MLVRLGIIILSVVIITACSDSTKPANNAAHNEIKKVELSRSVVAGSDQIHIRHRLLSEPLVGEPLTIVLDFGLQPNQTLAVTFAASENFDLPGDPVQVFESDDNGKIRASIYLLPMIAGKTYLTFIAATVDGEAIRSYAIVLKVADQSGVVPRPERSKKQRIDLPSSAN